jgi:hypothetical protein
MWKFLKRRHTIEEGDFSPRHMDNTDELSDEYLEASDKFHCTSSTTDTKMPFFLQWKLLINGLHMDM